MTASVHTWYYLTQVGWKLAWPMNGRGLSAVQRAPASEGDRHSGVRSRVPALCSTSALGGKIENHEHTT